MSSFINDVIRFIYFDLFKLCSWWLDPVLSWPGSVRHQKHGRDQMKSWSQRESEEEGMFRGCVTPQLHCVVTMVTGWIAPNKNDRKRLDFSSDQHGCWPGSRCCRLLSDDAASRRSNILNVGDRVKFYSVEPKPVLSWHEQDEVWNESTN